MLIIHNTSKHAPYTRTFIYAHTQTPSHTKADILVYYLVSLSQCPYLPLPVCLHLLCIQCISHIHTYVDMFVCMYVYVYSRIYRQEQKPGLSSNSPVTYSQIVRVYSWFSYSLFVDANVCIYKSTTTYNCIYICTQTRT